MIRQRKINAYFVSGRFPEIESLANEILRNKTQILELFLASKQQKEGDDNTNGPISLLDVFKVVNRNNYPLLWDVVLKHLAVIPTSVSCEQSFSRLRNKMHENMKKETTFSFMVITHKNPTFSLSTWTPSNHWGNDWKMVCVYRMFEKLWVS